MIYLVTKMHIYAHVYVQTDYFVRIVILRMHYSTGKKVGAGKKLEEKMAT